jgi:hypothetical protein
MWYDVLGGRSSFVVSPHPATAGGQTTQVNALTRSGDDLGTPNLNLTN